MEIQSREYAYQGFVSLKKFSCDIVCLINLSILPCIVQRELIRRKEAAGVLIYNDTQRVLRWIEQFLEMVQSMTQFLLAT